MADDDGKRKRKGAVALAELVGPVIDPVVARRGFASVDLIALWPEIVGPAHAAYTEPERIAWPRETDRDGGSRPGVLFLKVEGPRAILVQHELPHQRLLRLCRGRPGPPRPGAGRGPGGRPGEAGSA